MSDSSYTKPGAMEPWSHGALEPWKFIQSPIQSPLPSPYRASSPSGVLTLDLVPNLAERCLDDGGLDDGSGSRDRHVQFLAGEMSGLFFLHKMLLVMMYLVKV